MIYTDIREAAFLRRPNRFIALAEMDGRETFLNLKVDEDTEKIPVIFLTSVSDPKRVKDVISMQPAGYILKPVEADKLIEKVHEVLGVPEI